MKNDLNCSIEIVMANKCYDCNLDINRTLLANIELILIMVKDEISNTYNSSNNLLVYEKYTNRFIELNKKVKDLYLSEGTTLLIY
ncbi:MAG: hypothetical protein PUF67_07390 [Firmicutes bacterium]|nr:hypothetical protein [Erysipelotrichaceae bacterium]MDD6526037.1 hypothetical protein [Bacillota bacterium]MDD7227632.1 hypothetical protein [Bacillota bacterium]MDY4972705.1 hypothetical protein [Erysipelotrichaceae bacterium]MDY5997865.1 hypothetical protein [Erysipelotrichaceae bacterium]